MTNFGVFIDLGGVDGLLHITDISWGRINHPEEVLNLDDKVQIVVLDFDDDKKRISLGMKQLTAHPWDALSASLEVGSRVQGKIVNVADYGAFLELAPGVEGLIHVSEMSWSQHLRNPADFVKVGDEIEAVVLTLDKDDRKMSLGIKQLTEDPWTKGDMSTKYAVGTKHKGVVRNLTNFGLFLELEEGIDGLVHVSDLSWTKKIKHPSEFVKVGDELDVAVLGA
jgi:small subunit ribosomal protein S1